MTTYKYKGVSPDGARVSGVIKAYDEFEAVSQLRETCSVVTKIEAVPEQKEGGVSFGSRRIKAKELAILCSQFAIILTSGLPIDRCVEMVAAQARSREIQRVLEHVAEDVSGGYSLAQSFTNAGTAFPVTFIETIRAGEQSGTLELCFDRLHKYYDKSAKTHAKLVSTLTYPVLVLIVAAIVFMVIMLFAVPMFTSAFAELGSDLPPITRGLIAVSDFFLHYWWVFVLMILAFCIVRLLLRRSDRGRMFLAAGKLKRSEKVKQKMPCFFNKLFCVILCIFGSTKRPPAKVPPVAYALSCYFRAIFVCYACVFLLNMNEREQHALRRHPLGQRRVRTAPA